MTTLWRATDVAVVEAPDGLSVVVAKIPNGPMYKLGGPMATLWHLLDRPCQRTCLVAEALSYYVDPPSSAEEQLSEALDELVSRFLVHADGNDRAARS